MIRIHRPRAVPLALRAQRKAGLARAFDALNLHGVGSQELNEALSQYDGGKQTLFKKQHRKCAFCGRRVGFKGNHVEHFRPKREVHRHLPGATPRVVESVGYWWLTWSWSNQLFACGSCNTGHKQNYFPLAPASAVLMGPQAPYHRKRLQPAHEDLSVEAALLVDPAAEDPLDHIEWRVVNPAEPKGLWKWSPHPLTSRGDVTIRVLGLLAQADDVAAHVRDNLRARTSAICALVDAGNHAAARADWLQLGRDVASPQSELAGPTWNVLHILVDAVRRTAAALPVLPRP